MTALAKDRKTDEALAAKLFTYPVKGSTKIYGGAMVALNASGLAVPASADPTLKIIGIAEILADNSSGADSAIKVLVRRGAFYIGTPSSGADQITTVKGQLCFASDDNTVNTTDGQGLYPPAGVVVDVRTDGQVGVALGQPSLFDDVEVITSAFYCRAVTTSALAAYTRTAGVILANANGAVGAVFDGVTPVVGDVVLIPAGIAAAVADAGPWQFTALGDGSNKFQLKRPDWWFDGMAIPQSKIIQIGPEGTLFKGTEWKSFCTTATKLVDTDDPLLWPRRVVQSVALVAGTTTVSNVPVRSTTLSSVQITRTIANTSTATTGGYYATNGGANGITAGALGTASVICQACVAAGTINNADISTVNIAIENW